MRHQRPRRRTGGLGIGIVVGELITHLKRHGCDRAQRFMIAEVALLNTDGILKTGMLGTGKISVGTRRVVTALFRKPVRYIWTKIWPLLP